MRNLAIEAEAMSEAPRDRETVFTTPWFQILAEPARGGGQPHYLIDLILYERGVRALIEEEEFYSAPACAALLFAVLGGGLKS